MIKYMCVTNVIMGLTNVFLIGKGLYYTQSFKALNKEQHSLFRVKEIIIIISIFKWIVWISFLLF